ncbi:MAG: large repetitive protein, partial [Acidobacteriota bacterium]|nr:large repetitive protein [Acidobacteriota bacterium]
EIVAATRDGLRTGRNTIIVDQPNQVLSNVVITLSGLGVVEITVTDAAKNPISDQEVALLGNCDNACGCIAVKTDGQGRARFTELPIGRITARATRNGAGYYDQAQTSVSLTRDGETVFGILAFPGVGSVAGIVLDPDGKPTLGADVSLRSKLFDEDSCSLVDGVSHRMRTDESGRFQFNGVNIGNVSVTATQSFYPTAAGESFTLNAAGAHKEVTLRLTNTISGELSGTIYLPDGETRAGAGVEVTARGPLPDVTVVTDVQGNYQFAKIFPQGSYTVTVSDPVTGGVAQEAIFLRAAQDLQRDLRLKGRGTVRVTVVDGAGQPVQKAFVRLVETGFPNRNYESVIAPSNLGVATFNNVYEGTVSAEASDAFARGGRVSSVLPRPGDTIELKVAMTTTGKIRGKFLRPDGVTPIPFGIVKLIAGNRVIGQTATPGSGDVGAFSFDYVPAGPVRLEAQDPLTARTGFAAGTISAESETLNLDVLAQGLGSVQGLVTSNGVAQPGAHVDVASGTFRASAIADSTGNYLMEGVPEGRVAVTASIDGNFLSGTTSATLTGEGTVLTLDVALRDSGTVTGVVMRSNGTPAPLSVVTVQVGGTGGGTLATTTDGEGAYTLERVPAGLATATAEVAGGSDKGRATGEVEGGQTLTLPIALNGTGIVSGHALDSAGNPTAGDLTFASTGAFPSTYILKVGTDGAFTLRDVLAGSFTATLRTQNGSVTLYGSKSGAILPDITNDVTVQLQPTGSVKGIVKRADGTTAAYGASVVIDLLPNRGSIAVQTDNSGAFNANGIPLGALKVRVTDPLTAGIAMTPEQVLSDNGQVIDVQTLVLDDTPVAVVSVDPADGTIGVATNQPIVLAFSDALASASGIALKDGTANVGFGAALSADAKSVTLTGTWPDAKELTIVVSTAATDIFGRHPLTAFTSTFRTVDLSPPHVAAIVPANGAFQVDPSATITITYDEALSTLPQINVTPAVTGTATASSPTTVTFTPSAPLAIDTRYTVSSNGAFDASGNRQTIAFTSSFGTTDTIAPVLTMASPASNTWVRSARPQIQVNAADATSGVAPATGTMKLDGQDVVPSLSGSTIYYAPPADLGQGSHDVQATIADRAGNRGSMQGSFRIDTVAPSIPTIGGITAGTKVQGLIPLSATSADPTSGLDRIEVMIDGSVFQTLRAPDYAVTYNTNSLGEGPRTFTARAFDVAGNMSETSAAISAAVDNRPLTVSFSAPQANAPVRDVVSVQAAGSEVMARIDFSAGEQIISDSTAPYEATFDLTAFGEGPQQISATAYGLSGETAQASVTVVIDRTAPSAPSAGRITAEPPQNGSSLLFAYSGAVEGSASIEITNTVNNATTIAKAAPDGTFSAYITAAIDDALRLVAIDVVGNRSEPSTITVRSTPSLPPSQGATALEFNGLLVDRVGMTAGALTPDGNNDAVFTLSISIGDGTTRTLSYIDLTGPSTRSTRPAINAVLGVAQDAGGALLNRTDGAVSFPVTSGTTLTLFAGDGGFIRPGITYTVTAVFTDGSRFVDSYYLVPPEDRAQVAHAASIESLPATVAVPANGAATSTLTITNIRDIHGNIVPDGSRIALTATAWASRNPRNAPIGSAGGAIVDGETAANNANFKVFTIQGGRVVATYSSAPVSPNPRTGTFAVVQMMAADVDGNVIGTEAAATVEIPL